MIKQCKNALVLCLPIAFAACAAPLDESGAAPNANTNATPGVTATEPIESMSHAMADEVASIALSDGRRVDFVSVAQGHVAIREIGPLGSARLAGPAEKRGMDAIEIYEYLAAAPAPDALLRAMDRASAEYAGERELVSDDTVEPAPGPQSEIGKGDSSTLIQKRIVGTASHDEFVNAFCGDDPDYTEFNWVWVTGAGSLTRSDIGGWESAATSVIGTIRFVSKQRQWYTWKNLADHQIQAGWYIFVDDEYGGNLDYDARATVSESEGDTYSMCTRYWK